MTEKKVLCHSCKKIHEKNEPKMKKCCYSYLIIKGIFNNPTTSQIGLLEITVN